MEKGKHYFSIGEVSKLFNLSVQALRHYDQLDIVKPSYVNEENGYRYYSLDQFVVLDFLKICKASQVPLKEIKEILAQPLTTEHTKQLLLTQERLLAEKIERLSMVRESIARKRGDIEYWQQRKPGSITAVTFPERPILFKRVTLSSEMAFDLMYRELMNSFDTIPSFLSLQTGIASSRQAWLERGQCEVIKMFVTAAQEAPAGYEADTIPAGTYLSLTIEDSYREYIKYYDQLRQYVEKHGIETIGEIYEVYVISLPTNEHMDHTLWELQVRIAP